MFDGFTDIESVEIIGLPDGAAMNAGSAGGEGMWLLQAADVEGLELLPADGHWSVANLTVKVTATEEATGDKVINMAAIRMEIAGSPSEPPETKETAGPSGQRETDVSEGESPEPDGGKTAVDIRHLVPPPPEPRPQPEPTAKDDNESPPGPVTSDALTKTEPPAQGTERRDAAPDQQGGPLPAPEAISNEPEAKRASIRLQPVKKPARKPATKPAVAGRQPEAVSEDKPEPEGTGPSPQPQAKEKAGASARLRPAIVRKADAPPVESAKRPETLPAAKPAAKPASKPAARKAGVVLTKPETSSRPTTPGDRRRPTGEIVVRLGGAPERGDPHYRIAIGGRQVASGNVDWALGLPAIEDGDDTAVCWQTVRFPWDFAAAVPDEISVRYELGHGSGSEDGGALLVDWIDVDGLRVRDDGTYAHADGGRIPWPGSDRLKSCVGELVFDVAGAFAGEPRRKRDRKTDGTGSSADAEDEAGKGAQEPAQQPLVVHVSEEDAADSVVISELAALRSFVLGRDDPRIDPGREGTYDRLGLASGTWSDVVAIGPDGKEFDLDKTGGIRSFSVAAGEKLKRKFLFEATKRALPATGETNLAGQEGEDARRGTATPPADTRISVESGREMKRRFLAAVIDRLPFTAAPDADEGVDARAPNERTRTNRSTAAFDTAVDTKNRYLDGFLRAGLARLEAVLKRRKDLPIPEAESLALPVDTAIEATAMARMGDGNPIPKRQAARAVRNFYGRTLKRALDKLQSTVFEDGQMGTGPWSSDAEPRRSPPGATAGGPGEAATRDFAERMRTEFFDNALRKAMARGASTGIDGHG